MDIGEPPVTTVAVVACNVTRHESYVFLFSKRTLQVTDTIIRFVPVTGKDNVMRFENNPYGGGLGF